MIEHETMFTVVGIVLLGITYGMNSSYIWKNDTGGAITGAAVPFGFNLALLVYILYGIRSVSKMKSHIEVFIMVFLVTLSFVEIYFMWYKPSTWYGIPVAWFVVTGGALVRLYFLISLNCDFAKSVFVVVAKRLTEVPPKQSVAMFDTRVPDVKPDQIQPDWNKAFSTFESALRRTELTKEEKMEQINKFRAAWGKPPKEVVLTGGQR